jgi:hypothetical protein
MAASGFYHDLYMSQFRYDAALQPDGASADTSEDGKDPTGVIDVRPEGVVGGE